MRHVTAVVIPAYNAGSTIGRLIPQITGLAGIKSVVVVNDGSRDDTAQRAAAAGAIVISHPANRGKGAALRSGFEFVLSSGTHDSVITMDADLQHDPSEIPKLFETQASTAAQIVIGSRSRFSGGMPVHRILSNLTTSALVSSRTGVVIPDSQSGYRYFAREVLMAVRIDSDGYEAETEILIKAARRGFRISSAPIATIYGSERSYMSHWKTTWRFLQVLLREY